MKRFFVLIAAAGVGARFGAKHPKQYVRLHGKTVLEHTVALFAGQAHIHAVAVAASPEDEWIDALGLPAQILRCGGASRAQSVRNGLTALLERGMNLDDWILVHDAARCCLPQEALDRLLAAAGADIESCGALLALPVADTLKRADERGQVDQTIERSGLWQAQTPQLFQARALHEALSGSLEALTDEASALERMGQKPKLVLGDSRNLKLTWPADEILVKAILQGVKS